MELSFPKHQTCTYQVLATEATHTLSAPRQRSALVASRTEAPVVITSSTSSNVAPSTEAAVEKLKATLAARSSRPKVR